MLKLYCDFAYTKFNKAPTIILLPFIDHVSEQPDDPDYGRFLKYKEIGKNIFQIVSNPAECDYILLSFEYDFSEVFAPYYKELEALAKKHTKEILVFYNNDNSAKISLNHSVIFRTSFYKSTKQSNELAFPGWSKDFKEFNLPDKLVGGYEKPSIAYCGYGSTKLSIKNRLLIKYSEEFKKGLMHSGSQLRSIVLNRLHSNPDVQCNFILREGFWAPGLDKHHARKEYISNMYSSIFTLVVRGAGNFSYRFYETFSAGRIPLFIDTDCVLPFDGILNYNKHLLKVDFKQIHKVDKLLLEFFNDLGKQGLIDMQISNRKLYDNYLCPQAFFSRLGELINSTDN